MNDKQRLLEDSPKYWASRLPEGADPFWDKGLLCSFCFIAAAARPVGFLKGCQKFPSDFEYQGVLRF